MNSCQKYCQFWRLSESLFVITIWFCFPFTNQYHLLSVVNTSVADLGEDSTLHGIDPNTGWLDHRKWTFSDNEGLNSSREEGELEDDEMDTSSYPITPKKVEDVNSAV